MVKLLGSAGNLGGDFCGEIVYLLLDALALDEVDGVNKLDLAAQIAGAAK